MAGGCAQKVMELNLVGSWLQGVLLLGSYSSSQCCLMSLSMRYMKGLNAAVVRLQMIPTDMGVFEGKKALQRD